MNPIEPGDVPQALNQLGQNLGPALGSVLGAIMVVWGGVASFVQRIRIQKQPFRISSFVGDLTIAGFCGISVGLLLSATGYVHPYVIFFCMGMGAHMGARGIGLLENWYVERAQRIFGSFGVDRRASVEVIIPPPTAPQQKPEEPNT